MSRIELGDGWGLWPIFQLRGAGFPMRLVQAMAAPETTDAVDSLLSREDDCARARAAALAACEAAHREADRTARRAWIRVIRSLRRGEHRDPPARVATVNDNLAKLRIEMTACDTARETAARSFRDESARISAALRRIAGSDRFRCAVLLQNRAAVHTAIEPLSRSSPETVGKKNRRREILVASYLQRYCAKADTIGFFGPMGWGRFGDGLVVLPGPELVTSWAARFEPWAARAVAAALIPEPEIRRWLPPRLSPVLRINGDQLEGAPGARGLGGTIQLKDHLVRLLSLCDGQRTPVAIAEQLGADIDALLDTLRQLSLRGWLLWEVPILLDAEPERGLRDFFAGCSPDPASTRAQETVAAMLSIRDRIGSALFTAPELDIALGELEVGFRALTGSAPQRNPGQTYGGRTLLYADCRRDLKLEIPPAIATGVAEPLTLVLASGRWLTWEVARGYREVFEQTFATLSAGSERVHLPRFWRAVAPALRGPQPEIVSRATIGLQERWAAALGLRDHEDSSEIRFPTRDVAPAIKAAFAAPEPGWRSARHHCPDIMVAAASVEAIAQGDYTVVLGELHPGLNTLATLSAVSLNPYAEELRALYAEDIPEVGIAPIPDDDFCRSSHDSRLAALDLHLDTGSRWSSWRPAEQICRIGDLDVVRGDGGLMAESGDRRHRFDLLEIFERPIKIQTVVAFSPFPVVSHRARILLGGLVVAREAWAFAPEQLAFRDIPGSSIEQLIEARRFVRRHHLPRYVFVSIPEEVKPVFVDLCCPTYIALLAAMARRASRVTLTEMLPRPDQHWLPDSAGDVYTCELRLVAVTENAKSRSTGCP